VPTARNFTLDETLDLQRAACAQLGSQVYADVLAGVRDDVAAGGQCEAILGSYAGDAWSSALPLRFLGAVHRLVLEGAAPALAAHYPSAGGTPGPTLVADFLATVADHRPAVEAGLERGVQTNEVGRSAALVGGYAEVARRSGMPLRVFELGASAGLNLRWDHFWYDTGKTTCGDPASDVRFVGVWRTGGDPATGLAAGVLPELDPDVAVVERAGCDRNPIDPVSEEGRLTLRSYLWPDQEQRRARLDAALAIAARVPAPIDHRDLGAWLEGRLADRPAGIATVVYHSSVWQYVTAASRDRMRAALRRAGAATTAARPIAWLRMEPAGPVSDLRLTWWPGGEEEVLGVAGYHGAPVHWGVRPPPR
jgi:hypothetical protein